VARRRGQFGRLPRAAPDLTNALVALIREAASQTDANYVDAWKLGGEVDGEGVDDERLLQHFKDRRDALDPNDPQWDEWNNRVAQYEFSIEESKMSLKFDQKKISEAQMGAFYKKWAGREEIQQNSEFYRHLLSQAAKWNASANAGRASRGRGNSYDAHNNWVNRVYKRDVEAGETATGYLLAIAKAWGAAPPNADSLDDVNDGSDSWAKVLDVIEDGKSDDPYIQGIIDEATRAIQKAGQPGFTWSQSNLNAILDKANRGYKSLIGGAMNKTEKDQWTKRKGETGYEGTRIKNAGPSARIEQAADDWSNALDDCAGDPYCARAATKAYADRLKQEAGSLVAGQGVTNMSNVDQQQQAMLIATIGALDDIAAGKPLTPSGVAALSGNAGQNTLPYTQPDAMVDASSPQGLIAGIGNAFNAQIKMLDEPGAWVSSEPALNSTGQPQFDAEGNPVYQFTVHPATEPPQSGMVPVPGVTVFTDPGTAGTYNGAPVGTPKTIAPTQYVRPAQPPVHYVDGGGNAVSPQDGPEITAATEGGATYMTLPIIGPDGTTRYTYRTGNGMDQPYMYHPNPPVAAGTRMERDPATGAMAPVLTVTAGTDEKGNPTRVSDTTPINAGVAQYRTPMKSGLLVLGSFDSPGAASVSSHIDTIFATNGNKPPTKDQTDAGNKSVSDYAKTIMSSDPTLLANNRDLRQLNQTVQLHGQGLYGQTLDDAYTTRGAYTPSQQTNRDALLANGFRTDYPGAEEELGRRSQLLDEIAGAEQRVDARRVTSLGMFGLGLGDPMRAAGAALQGTDMADITRAKQDVYNPLISVSNIKVPGMNPLMQPATGQGPESWISAFVGANYNPATGIPAPTVGTGPQPYAPPPPPTSGAPGSERPNNTGPGPNTATPESPQPPSIAPPPKTPDFGNKTPSGAPAPTLPSPKITVPPKTKEHGKTQYDW
jgi:hypothetical protein